MDTHDAPGLRRYREGNAAASPRGVTITGGILSAASSRAALAVLLASLLIPRAAAHETWLLPRSFVVEAGESLELLMTSGMDFPALASGIDRRRIAEAVLLQDGTRRRLVPSRDRVGALELTGVAERGLACAWVQLRPRILEIEEEDSVEHYLDEIGAPATVRDAWTTSDEEWRESYAKVARSYLRAENGRAGVLGDTASSVCYAEMTSARFDILPLADPTRLGIGDELELQVLFDGRPLTGQAVGLLREGAEPAPLIRSGADGRVFFTIAGAGRHMIYATNLRPASGEGYNWESDFITLTFEAGRD